MKNKKIGYLILIVLLSLLFIFLILDYKYSIYYTILEPAWHSTYSDCLGGEQRLAEKGIVTLAEVRGVYNETTKKTKLDLSIYVDERSPNYNAILKHENIHIKQFERHYLAPCVLLVPHYFNEVEAYAGMQFNDNLYKKLYGNYSSIVQQE